MQYFRDRTDYLRMFVPAIYLVTLHAVFKTVKKGKFSDNIKLLI